MARSLNRLSAKKVESLKKPGWHADGGGLYLRVQSAGARSWVIVDTKGGKRKERGIGSVSDVSLAQARAIRDAGPSSRLAEAPIFKDFFETLIPDLENNWRGARSRLQWETSLRDYAQPIMRMRVDAITTEDVLSVLRPLWAKRSVSAQRLRGRIERILSAAKAKGFIVSPWQNPATWRGHLDNLLSRPSKMTGGHHPAMDYADVPAFMAKLRKRNATSARALEFLILGANRTGEVLRSEWIEIDETGGLWVIPANRMKARKEHTVVLGNRQLEILKEMRTLATVNPLNADYVFPGRMPKRPMTDCVLNDYLKRMGYSLTVHGFRSSFKDWASDETDYADELSEEALAHTVGSAVRRAYRRGESIAKRRLLMADWEAYCLSKIGTETA